VTCEFGVEHLAKTRLDENGAWQRQIFSETTTAGQLNAADKAIRLWTRASSAAGSEKPEAASRCREGGCAPLPAAWRPLLPRSCSAVGERTKRSPVALARTPLSPYNVGCCVGDFAILPARAFSMVEIFSRHSASLPQQPRDNVNFKRTAERPPASATVCCPRAVHSNCTIPDRMM